MIFGRGGMSACPPIRHPLWKYVKLWACFGDIVKSGVDSCYGGLRFAQEMTGRFWAKVMGRKLIILDTGWRCFLG